MSTLDSVISGLSPVSYISDLSSSVVDTGSAGITWTNAMTLNQANIVPSESGGSSKSALSNGGSLKASADAGYTKFSIFLALKYAGVTNGFGILFDTGFLGNGGFQAWIGISDDGAGNTSVTAVSNNTGPSVAVTYTFTVGATYDIGCTWDTAAGGTVTIYVNGVAIGSGTAKGAPSDAKTWVWGNGIGTGDSANGNYQRMAVFSTVLTGANFTSLHSAFVGPDVVGITSPNGGNTFGTAQTIPISGTAGGTVTAVDVYFTTNGGTSTTLIASNVAVSSGTWSTTWAGAHSAGTTYQIYVTKHGDTSVNAISAADFTIATSTITVKNPLCAKITNYADAITWAWTGLSSDNLFNLTLSIDGGMTFPIMLASGVPGTQGFGRFWVAPSYVSATCQIRLTGTGAATGLSSTTSNFQISAESMAVLQPTMTVGGGSGSFSPPAGSGAIPNLAWAMVPGQAFSTPTPIGVGALSARTDSAAGTGGDPSPGIECVVMRVNGGPWVNIHQPSLNSSHVRPVPWTPSAHMHGDSSFATIRATQEYCATIDPTGLSGNTHLTVQSYGVPFIGTPTALPDIVIVANPSGGTTYYLSASTGTSGGAGTQLSPIDTIANAVTKAFNASALEGLTLLAMDGSFTLDSNSGTTGTIITTQPITIQPAPGAFGNTKLIGVSGTVYWQANSVRIKDMLIDWSDNTRTAMLTSVANEQYWFDGCEVKGAGPGGGITFPLSSAAPNGFAASYITECYIHDIGGGSGGNDFLCEPNILRNTFNWNSNGRQGADSPLSLNFYVKDLLQNDGAHSDIYGFVASTNKVVISTISENAPRSIAALFALATIRQAFINCDFVDYVGNVNGSGMGGQDCLYAYLRFTNDPIAYADHTGPNVNQQMHGNIFDYGVTFSNPATEATWTSNDYGSGSNSADATATSGSQLTFNADRTPVAGNANFNSGLPIWPYDALNRRRGLYSLNHATARGPYAASNEYAGAGSRTGIGLGIGIVTDVGVIGKHGVNY